MQINMKSDYVEVDLQSLRSMSISIGYVSTLFCVNKQSHMLLPSNVSIAVSRRVGRSRVECWRQSALAWRCTTSARAYQDPRLLLGDTFFEAVNGADGRRLQQEQRQSSESPTDMPITSRPMSTAASDVIGQGRDTIVQFVDSLNRRLATRQPLVLVLASVASTYALLRLRVFYYRSERSIWARAKSFAFSLLRRVPAVQRRIERELADTARSIAATIHGCDRRRDFCASLPAAGWSRDTIMDRANDFVAMNEHFDYARGRVSGAVYTDIDASDHLDVLTDVSAVERQADRRVSNCRSSDNMHIPILYILMSFLARVRWRPK